MALQDFRVKESSRYSAQRYRTKAGQTAIKAGEFVLQDTSGDVEYVEVATNGVTNSRNFVGIAVSADTVTATADGYVYVVDDPNAKFIGKPTTASNLADTILNTVVTLDVDGDGVQTVDENDTTDGALFIHDYDSDKGTITVSIDLSAHLRA